ncbi:hypothetical protein [Variovorax sp.]|uniref:hypothetical protein n=1 Tax=Variovorax sp. TaxID=1871043 RepID=UPI003BAC52F2
MTEKNNLQKPLTVDMPLFDKKYINQVMVDALNLNPSLVEKINSYNSDVIRGYRTDPSTGKKWSDPENGSAYRIAPFEFTNMANGSSPRWRSLQPGVGAIVFGQNSNYLNASTPVDIAKFIAYLAHEIDHYYRGVEHFNQERRLLKSLNSDENLTPKEKVAALAGLIARREGEGIAANYETSKFYASLSEDKRLNIPILTSSKQDFKGILDKASANDISDLIAQAARFNSDFNQAGNAGGRIHILNFKRMRP